MRRKTPRPYGQSVKGIRVISMLLAMLVLWMLFERHNDPATSCGVFQDCMAAESSPADAETPKPEEPEKLVPGPNDQDPDELAAIQDQFEAVTDRAPLKSREMDAYWRLMDWGLTQPFSELEKRARDDVPFTQLWEQPELYRGKLIRLRMHIRRVLEYPAPENPSEVKKVYEAWGWTDESRSFPYVVVFPDAPAGLPVGTDIRAEIVFVGYFLKVMTYTAFDNVRGAPLLVGRAKLVSKPVAMKSSKVDPWVITLILIGGAGFLGYSTWSSLRSRRKSSVKMLPKELAVADPSAGDDLQNPFAQLGQTGSSAGSAVAVETVDLAVQEKVPSSEAKSTPEEDAANCKI